MGMTYKQAQKFVKKKEKQGFKSDLYGDGFSDGAGWAKDLMNVVFVDNVGDIKNFIEKINKKPFMKRYNKLKFKSEKDSKPKPKKKEGNMAELNRMSTEGGNMRERYLRLQRRDKEREELRKKNPEQWKKNLQRKNNPQNVSKRRAIDMRIKAIRRDIYNARQKGDKRKKERLEKELRNMIDRKWAIGTEKQ